MEHSNCSRAFDCISDRVLANRWMVVSIRLMLFSGSTIVLGGFVYGVVKLVGQHGCYLSTLLG
jgi:hypothetical protein